MPEKYIFRKIKEYEIPTMFELIKSRVKWMDKVGIKQWNVTDYLNVYPLSYYMEHFRNGEVFVLVDSKDEMVCAAVLKSKDERWKGSNFDDDIPSFYVHNLASKIGAAGTGRVFLELAEKYAKSVGKVYMRLDSAVDNDELTAYYDSMGYIPVGFCIDGAYEGILRQKKTV